MAIISLRHACLTQLVQTDPQQKASAVRALAQKWRDGEVILDASEQLTNDVELPGHPNLPKLVPPFEVKHRSMRTLEGRAALVHALAHIEFNAINLALDAVWRFNDMPEQFYADWLKVADEEAYHFSLLNEHLESLGFAYGDFPAHNGLWEMAEKTKGDVLERVALVPRVLEARGLDVTPSIKNKIVQAGDHRVGEILDIILHDEIGHVAIGNHWFHWLCGERNLAPLETFEQIRNKHDAPKMRPPFNVEAREAAGFTADEIAYLTQP